MSMKDINEEINRIKQLFTEERLYGNLVDKKIINEQVIKLKSAIDGFITKRGKSSDDVSEASAKLKLDGIGKKIGDFKSNDQFVNYIGQKGVGGFRNDLDDLLNSYFNVNPNNTSRTDDIEEVVDGILDILMKYSKDIKNGTLNFDKLGQNSPKTKSLFQSIDGFEDFASKKIKKTKTKNIPQLTSESKEVLKQKMKTVGSTVSGWSRNGYSNFIEKFFELRKSAPWKVGWGKFFKAYAKMQGVALAANLVTLPVGLAKDFA